MRIQTFFLGTALISAAALATPPNRAVLNGRPTEYDGTDLRGTYTGGGGTFGAGTYITNLFVTWDTNYLYIALQGAETGPDNGNKLVVMLDADPDAGTGATTTTNWTGVVPDYIRYNDVGWQASVAGGATNFGLDYMIASEGFYNNIMRILYDGITTPDSNNVESLFDSGNGETPVGTPVDMAVFWNENDNCGLEGFEARIPWSVLYPTNGRFGTVQTGKIVPTNATLRLFANIHNNDPTISYSSSDVIPQQTSGNASFAAGLLTSDNYLDVLVDGNGDGIPDVATGDVNAPYIAYASGVQGKRQVFAQFNEGLNAGTATDINNWHVGVNKPGSISMLSTNTVLLSLTNDLPAAGTQIELGSSGVQDNSGNQKSALYCLEPAASGLTNTLTVRFLLETASGLGLTPGSTNFFVNGGSYPLAFGYPPSTSSPLSLFSGTLYYRDVSFPPGTPQTLNYKYSGIITATGTNTYEAVRLSDYSSAARSLTLPTNATSIVVTDYLGAAAAPYRDPGTNTGYSALYSDARRGDAGVRQRTTMTFQLDLSQRDRSGISRVLIQGTDPLRGFNVDGTLPAGVGDFAGNGSVGYVDGGLTLYDDGTHGDTNANDGIFARQWVFTTDGTDADATFEPDFPNSLVGGGFGGPPPYFGSGWSDRRSPRSIGYKFYVVKLDSSVLEYPAANIEYYIEDPSVTNVIRPPFLWDSDTLPPPPPSNSPTVEAVSLTTSNAIVIFTNVASESSHGLQLSTNPVSPWLDYGHRASGAGGVWTAIVAGVGNASELYRAFSGDGNPFDIIRWTPNPIPATGANLQVTFNQNHRNLAGNRDPRWFGRILGGGFTNLLPMTFSNYGIWGVSIPVPAATNNSVQFLFTNPQVNTFDKTYKNQDFYVNVGGRMTWTPETPTQGGLFSVTYDASNGVLATATQVLFHHGFDNFGGVTMPTMTNLLGTNLPGLWAITITVPLSNSNSVDWVVQNGAGTFDNNNNNDWRAFIAH